MSPAGLKTALRSTTKMRERGPLALRVGPLVGKSGSEVPPRHPVPPSGQRRSADVPLVNEQSVEGEDLKSENVEVWDKRVPSSELSGTHESSATQHLTCVALEWRRSPGAGVWQASRARARRSSVDEAALRWRETPLVTEVELCDGELVCGVVENPCRSETHASIITVEREPDPRDLPLCLPESAGVKLPDGRERPPTELLCC
mmetsp:Transcript_2567/g.7645  ORF Transcript_2567/g.7645 Transcript_2567/m.7645 type:complete len:203 (-) Transcript_2567:296-904(-)